MAQSSSTDFWYRWGLVLLVIAAGVYIERRGLVSLHLEYRGAVDNLARSESHLAELQEESRKLERRVSYLKSDPLELEATIRAEKKLLREGETIYRIVLPDEQSME